MKNKATKLIALILVIILALVLSACRKASSPEKITQTYFGALKSGDFNAAIECFTPAAQAQYKAALSISSFLFGANSDGINSLISAVVGSSTNGSYSNYKFKVTDTDKIDKEHARVSVDVYIDGDFSRTTTVSCVKYDSAWYIES